MLHTTLIETYTLVSSPQIESTPFYMYDSRGKSYLICHNKYHIYVVNMILIRSFYGRLIVINLHPRICGVYKVGSPLPTRYFSYA